MTYKELKDEFCKLKYVHPIATLTAHMIFTEDSFENGYPLLNRTYRITSDEKAFWPRMTGYSVFGNCLGGTDQGVWLDYFIEDERTNVEGSRVEDCYILEHMRDVATIPNAQRQVQDDGMCAKKVVIIMDRDKYVKALCKLVMLTEYHFNHHGIALALILSNTIPRQKRFIFKIQLFPGTRVDEIFNRASDIGMALGLPLFQPFRDKTGIYLAVSKNRVTGNSLSNMLASPFFNDSGMQLPLAIGYDLKGEMVFSDLAKMPHALYVGATNSGKSVGLMCLVFSLLYVLAPDKVNFLIFDIGANSMDIFSDIPHLSHPIVKDTETGIYVIEALVVDIGNITSRMAFKGAKFQTSIAVINCGGAEKLPGRGAMLYLSNDNQTPRYVQGAYVSPQEAADWIDQILAHDFDLSQKFVIPEFDPSDILPGAQNGSAVLPHNNYANKELARIAFWTLQQDTVSANKIAAQFRMGNRADTILDRLQEMGIVSEKFAKQPRSVLPKSVEDISPSVIEFLTRNGISQEDMASIFERKPEPEN